MRNGDSVPRGSAQQPRAIWLAVLVSEESLPTVRPDSSLTSAGAGCNLASMATTDSWNPAQYDKFKEQRSQPFFDLMHLLQLSQASDRPRVVDLGCGTGELTAELHRYLNAGDTLGLDSSCEMLKRSKSFETENLHFEQANIETWNAPQAYDVIFSNAALQWCMDHKGILTKLRQALKPGGQLAVQMPMNHDYPTHTIARAMSQEKPWINLLREPYKKQEAMLTIEEYASLMFRLGFSEQNVSLKVYGHVLESREGVIEWVRGTLLTYFQSRLSEQDFARFVAQFRERLFAVLPDDQPFFYPFKRVLIWGRV